MILRAKLIILAPIFFLALLTSAEDKKKLLLKPHALENQQSYDFTGQHGNNDSLLFQRGKPTTAHPVLEITASAIAWDSPGTGISLALEITNPRTFPGTLVESVLFVPSQIVVILPNGNSYRPYNYVEVLEQANAMKEDKTVDAYSGYNPPPVNNYKTVCSLSSNTANCLTTADQSQQAGYAVGFAIQAAIRNAIGNRTIKKYIQQIKTQYITSQQIEPGKTITGYVDLYVEDIREGPFVVRIPAGDKIYDFTFGPELVVVNNNK